MSDNPLGGVPYICTMWFPTSALDDPPVALDILQNGLIMRDRQMEQEGHIAVTPWEWDVIQERLTMVGWDAEEDEPIFEEVPEGELPGMVIIRGTCRAVQV